jgi:hypothetical protein
VDRFDGWLMALIAIATTAGLEPTSTEDFCKDCEPFLSAIGGGLNVEPPI